MAVNDTLATLLNELKHIAKSETVFGEPFVSGKTTVIPVSKISCGFAAGGSGKKEGLSTTGGGIQVIPVALITIVGDSNVKVHPIDPKDSVGLRLLGLAPDVIETVLKSVNKSSNKEA
ncbi:MAG: sporulation protein [Chitinivibrionia bacterium]|nr:sporulation protein [Chitinivibrionia bacterium]